MLTKKLLKTISLFNVPMLSQVSLDLNSRFIHFMGRDLIYMTSYTHFIFIFDVGMNFLNHFQFTYIYIRKFSK